MLVHYSKFPDAVSGWLDEAVFPKSEKWQIAVLTIGLLTYREKIVDYAKMLADKDGNINTEKLGKDMQSALDKVGGSFETPGIGWNMNKDDIDILIKHAEKYGAVNAH